MDLDMVKVSRPLKAQNRREEEQQQPKSEKELISVMEHLFASLGNIKEKAGIWHRIIYGDAVVALEMANPSENDEISFYVGAPKKFINIVERQIHSFYPKASIERVKDYNIFSPGSFTAASILKLKDKHHFPLRTYQTLESDPLNNITNVLGKFDEKKEGAAIQLLHEAGAERLAEKREASRPQNAAGPTAFGRETRHGFASGSAGGFLNIVFKKNEDKQKDILKQNKDTIQLTPEEQEVVKKIEGKAGKSGFDVNIRLVASRSHSGTIRSDSFGT